MGEPTVKVGNLNSNSSFTFKNNMYITYERRRIDVKKNGNSVNCSDVIGGYKYKDKEIIPTSHDALNILSIVASSSNSDGKTEISTADLAQLYENFKMGAAPKSILNINFDETNKRYEIQYHTKNNKNLDLEEGNYWMTFSLPKPQKATHSTNTQPKAKQHTCPSFWDDPFAWIGHRWLAH